MPYVYDDNIAYTCGDQPDDGVVSVTIGYESDGEDQNFSFTYDHRALTITCSKAMAAEIASTFSLMAEEE
jgi:hypothetical protein